MNIGIVGIGLIGGSLGLSLKKAGHHILGFDQSPKHLEQAREFGLIHEAMSFEELVEAADLVALAIPVDALYLLLPKTLDGSKSDQTIIDLGSTKKDICRAVAKHPNRHRYVAAHPIAGTEFSGPSAALPDLYTGKKMILCDTHLSNERAVKQVLHVLSALNMEVIQMGSEEHDKHLAYVSHLSHVTSFALSLTALAIEKDERQLFNLSGSGFASTVRLAKSSPDMWSPIFIQNKDRLLEAITAYQLKIAQIKEAIESDNDAALHTLISEANTIGPVLNPGKRKL